MLRLFTVLAIVFSFSAQTTFADDYEQGYKDGHAAAINPICTLEVRELCDSQGNMRQGVLVQALQNPCDHDSILYCDALKVKSQKKQKKLIRKLRRKLRSK